MAILSLSHRGKAISGRTIAAREATIAQMAAEAPRWPAGHRHCDREDPEGDIVVGRRHPFDLDKRSTIERIPNRGAMVDL
jgi:hypothetical protein